MQNYENFSNAAEVPPDPPPYSEKQPYYEEGGAFPWHPAPSAPPPPPLYPQAYPTQYGTGFGQVFAPQQGLYAVAAAPLGPKKDYLAFSIFSMFCFLPLGIAALVYSRKTRVANQLGNYTAAQDYSRKTRIFAQIACALGLVILANCLIIVFVYII